MPSWHYVSESTKRKIIERYNGYISLNEGTIDDVVSSADPHNWGRDWRPALPTCYKYRFQWQSVEVPRYLPTNYLGSLPAGYK